MTVEDELINYVLELVDDDICEELMYDEQENEYCEKNCENLCKECVIRFINKRIKDKKAIAIN